MAAPIPLAAPETKATRVRVLGSRVMAQGGDVSDSERGRESNFESLDRARLDIWMGAIVEFESMQKEVKYA